MCNRRKFTNRSIVVFLMCIAGYFALYTPAYGSEQWTGLEEQQLVALGESQLEDMRGGYLGFYFAITFRGYWDTQGNKWADVDYEAGFDGDTQSGQVTLTSTGDNTASGESGDGTSQDGLQFQTTAVLGGLNGSEGVFQINQVPGSNNIVTNGLIVNLTVYNVAEAQAPAVMETLKSLAPAF